MFTILVLSDLNDRDTVAEIGCGPGFFTIPLAKALSNGTLYALDIEDEMLEACRQRVAEVRLGNVEFLKCGEFDFPLDPKSVNGLFLAFVIQQSPDCRNNQCQNKVTAHYNLRIRKRVYD